MGANGVQIEADRLADLEEWNQSALHPLFKRARCDAELCGDIMLVVILFRTPASAPVVFERYWCHITKAGT